MTAELPARLRLLSPGFHLLPTPGPSPLLGPVSAPPRKSPAHPQPCRLRLRGPRSRGWGGRDPEGPPALPVCVPHLATYTADLRTFFQDSGLMPSPHFAGKRPPWASQPVSDRVGIPTALCDSEGLALNALEGTGSQRGVNLCSRRTEYSVNQKKGREFSPGASLRGLRGGGVSGAGTCCVGLGDAVADSWQGEP